MSYNVRTFRAPSMPEALAQVKRELGPNAVILGTRSLAGSDPRTWARRQRVEITAAPPDTPTAAPRLKRRSAAQPADMTQPPSASGKPELPEHLYPHFVRLVQNKVAEELAARLVQQAAAQVATDVGDESALRTAICEYIARMIPAGPGIELQPGRPRRVALVGPSGGGKSTTLAKLAAHFKLRREQRVAVLSLDMHRLDAHEQQRRYTEVLGVALHVAQTIAEVKDALKHLDAIDVLLIDTPGVGSREQGRFARLATLLRAARPDEIHLVLPVSLDPAVQTRVAQGFAPLGVSRVLLTRLDEVIGLGAILNVVERLSLRVSYVTAGQNVPDDIEEACGSRVAEVLLSVR